MNILKKQLKKEKFSKTFYGYHSSKRINDKKSALTYLDEIINYLNKYKYKSNKDYDKIISMDSRKKFIYQEVIDILNKSKKVEDPIYFVLGSLEEYMCNNCFVQHLNIDDKEFTKYRNLNDDYIKNGYMCLEEKNYIMSMIKEIKERID